MHPEDVGKADRAEDQHRDGKRRHGAQPQPQGTGGEQRGRGQHQGVGQQRTALRREAHERRHHQGVEARLGVGEVRAAVAALQDDPVGRPAPLRHEAIVGGAGVAEVEVPGQAGRLHGVVRLVANQRRPAAAVEGQSGDQHREQQRAEHGPSQPLAKAAISAVAAVATVAGGGREIGAVRGFPSGAGTGAAGMVRGAGVAGGPHDARRRRFVPGIAPGRAAGALGTSGALRA